MAPRFHKGSTKRPFHKLGLCSLKWSSRQIMVRVDQLSFEQSKLPSMSPNKTRQDLRTATMHFCQHGSRRVKQEKMSIHSCCPPTLNAARMRSAACVWCRLATTFLAAAALERMLKTIERTAGVDARTRASVRRMRFIRHTLWSNVSERNGKTKNPQFQHGCARARLKGPWGKTS